ncbi:MAG: FecR family protein [Proteobacteria bacterium]|nr:FecR family protein [Pseudomonadota bacterium]MBU1398207.1 FecR family protein [Pseudomonadota bacterium]MBU1568925.1 FecR family protein [Pseudomonadota bacterium]
MKKYFFISLIAVLFLLGWVVLSVADTGSPRGKSAAASLLPDELKSMKIDDFFVESKTIPVGSIQNATGHVVVVHKDTNMAYFATTGDSVYQQDVFYTLKDSRCRIKFSTEDIITMGENSKVVADEIVDDLVSKKKSSVISMLKGKAMFYVVRLFKYKTVSASVKTPTAVMGVRGTKFGVEVRKTGEKVADLSDNSFIYLAQNEPGNFETVVYGFDGEVEVNSTGDGSTNTVGAGETLVVDNLGAGDVEPTDPNAANQFVGDTEGGSGGTSGTESADAGEGEGGEAGETGDTADTASENIAQTLTTQTIETQIVSGTRVGYFSALLTRFDGTNTHLADVYTNFSRSDFNSSSVSGKSIVNPAGFITATDTGSDQTTYLSRINTVAGAVSPNLVFDSGDLGTTFAMDNPTDTPGWPTDDRLGQNSYMEWGFWAMSRWVPVDGNPSFAVTDRAYYIDGLSTPDAVVAGMTGSHTYAGPAWGTYFNGFGGIDMTGSFTSGINMTARTVTNFYMTVSDGDGYSASINGAGSFIGSSGEFKITGGNWYLNGTPPISASCTGSLFGPNAEHMGGAWAMDVGAGNNAAVGIFVGDKGGAQTAPSSAPPALPSPPTPPAGPS